MKEVYEYSAEFLLKLMSDYPDLTFDELKNKQFSFEYLYALFQFGYNSGKFEEQKD